MAEREHEPEQDPPELVNRDEPEPAWARDIRDRRKARADRLREVFDAFDGKLSKTPRDPA
jgi:hypothetical protein